MFKEKNKVFRLTEKNVIVFLISFFIVTLLGIILIDMLDIFGIRTYLFSLDWRTPFFWYHWFLNGGPVEFFQYSFLGFAAIYSARNSFKGSLTNKRFWSVFSIALIYLLIEDAGDPRHFIRYYVQQAAGETDGQGLWGTLIELIYFIGLGSIPLYAYFRYGRVALKDFVKTKRYLISGFFFYALAAGFSFIGSAFSSMLNRDFYTLVGSKVIDIIVNFSGPEVQSKYLGDFHESLSFYIMDSPFEESLELIGGALLLLAAVSFMRIVSDPFENHTNEEM